MCNAWNEKWNGLVFYCSDVNDSRRETERERVIQKRTYRKREGERLFNEFCQTNPCRRFIRVKLYASTRIASLQIYSFVPMNFVGIFSTKIKKDWLRNYSVYIIYESIENLNDKDL